MAFNTQTCKYKGFSNHKGFTIVELVIVIAVIGILAAVLIPTFSNIIDKANESKAKQEVINAMKEYITRETNINLDDYLILYYDSNDEEENCLEYIFGYNSKELYIIEAEQVIVNKDLYINEKYYSKVDTLLLSNFPDNIKLYKFQENINEHKVKITKEVSGLLISFNDLDTLENIYYPGEKVVIRVESFISSLMGLQIYNNGELVKEFDETEEWVYDFSMPNYDVNIELFPTITRYEEISFSQIYSFVNSIDVDEINEIYCVSNQSLYFEPISSDFSSCIYYSSQTEQGKNAINSIIRNLLTTTYDLTDEIEETGLPRKKYIILTDDEIYEFYYDEYISHNGMYYKNNNYEMLFGENVGIGLTFIRNDMPSIEYLQPVYVNDEELDKYIDLRKLIFEDITYNMQEPGLPTYDESSVVIFKGIYGSEADFITYRIKNSKTFTSGNFSYRIINNFDFEEYKKTYNVDIIIEEYNTGLQIIYDENKDVTIDDLRKYIEFDDNNLGSSLYYFSYSPDGKDNIFIKGPFIIDSDKVIYLINESR